MEITIDLPETTIKKVKAFGVLSGGGSADIESLLCGLVDAAVTAAIIEHVTGGTSSEEDAPEERAYAPPTTKAAQKRLPFPRHAGSDLSGISDGLGDDDFSEDDGEDTNASTDESAFIPTRGGLTEQDLEDDMSLSDPEHEAKVEAPPVNRSPGRPQQAAEQLFSELAGLPPPPVDPRAAQRKKQLKSKAKVTYASEVSGADA